MHFLDVEIAMFAEPEPSSTQPAAGQSPPVNQKRQADLNQSYEQMEETAMVEIENLLMEDQ